MNEVPEAAVSFGIFDVESGNLVASFTDAKMAHATLARLVEDDPEQARHLVLTYFDKKGHAVGSTLAEELLPL